MKDLMCENPSPAKVRFSFDTSFESAWHILTKLFFDLLEVRQTVDVRIAAVLEGAGHIPKAFRSVSEFL